MERVLATALEREHRDIDAGIEAFTAGRAAGQVDATVLTRAIEALRRHIYLEEELLFPPLRGAGMMPPVFVMLREHGEMWHTLDSLERELDRDPSGEPVLELCGALMPQLEAHNAKEEAILYAQADAVLSESAGAKLQRSLETGRMPDGWVCERARS